MTLSSFAFAAAAGLVLAPQGPAAADRGLVAPPGRPVVEAASESPQPAPGARIRLSLPDAIQRALQTSHRLAEIRARRSGAQASIDAGHAITRPQMALVAGYSRTNHVDEFGIVSPTGALKVIYPDIPDNYRTRLDLQWPIYTAGRADALVRAATAELEATGKDLDTARADLRLEVTRAFWALVTSADSLRVVEQSLGRMDAQLGDVRNRQQAGFLAPSDVLMVEAQRSRQHLLLIEARNGRDLAASDLKRLAGLPQETEIDPDATLDAAASPAPPVADLVAVARTGRPERQAIERRVAGAQARADAVASGLKPIVALAGGFDYARPNPRIFPRKTEWEHSWDVGVNVSWTFWDGGRVKAGVAEAASAREALGERLKEFDTVLDLEVRQRRLDVESAREAIGVAEMAVRSATEARRVLGERFAAGIATSTEVLDAQVALLQAELDRTRALANARLADARLERALGR